MQVAHHHHHIPVPVPVPVSKPVYYDHPPPSHTYDHPPIHSSGPPPPPYILDDDFPGYDYGPPHIQYRKDIEELKEWGIEPYDESYDQVAPQSGVIYPGPTYPLGPPKPSSKISGPHNSLPQSFSVKPSSYADRLPPPPPLSANSLAYSAYQSPPSSLPTLPSSNRQKTSGSVSTPNFVPSKSLVTQTKKQTINPVNNPQQQSSTILSQTRNPQQVSVPGDEGMI